MSEFYPVILTPVISSVHNFPDRKAFCIDEQFYTYEQFGQTISKIRTAIQSENFSNPNVGLVINDDLETYASIFALWLDGHSYVPLHPNWPIDRCCDIIEQVDIDLVLDSSEKSRYSNGGGTSA